MSGSGAVHKELSAVCRVNTVGAAAHACVQHNSQFLHVRDVSRMYECTANPCCSSPPGGISFFTCLHVH